MSFLRVCIGRTVGSFPIRFTHLVSIKYVSGATLLFDVELVGINQAPPPQNVFKQIDLDSDNQLSKEEVRIFFKTLLAF